MNGREERGYGAIVLGDIGGTNARFALLAEGRLGPSEWLAVSAFPTFGQALAAFVDRQPVEVSGAILAAAGPVEDNRCALTNSPWVVDGNLLERELGLAGVRVINDFAAVAWSLPELAPQDLVAIGGGEARLGLPAAALGPGTGLGLACLVPAQAGPIVVETEGGHATMAPTSRREDAVIAHLRDRLGHVSAERVLSGQGLVNLYQAIGALDRRAAPPRGPEEISAAALDGSCELSSAALDMFCGLLGSFAGNVALIYGARGGIYVGGGIAPRIVEFLARSPFRERFEDKGRYRCYLSAIPTRVIVHRDPALLGLRALAERQFPP